MSLTYNIYNMFNILVNPQCRPLTLPRRRSSPATAAACKLFNMYNMIDTLVCFICVCTYTHTHTHTHICIYTLPEGEGHPWLRRRHVMHICLMCLCIFHMYM